MKNVLHLWAVSNFNAGDYLLGPATRQWFENNVFRANFTLLSCRNYFNEEAVDRINEKYDALLIGGGGLILPDTNPNKISCWQWKISKDNIDKIKIPIYVVSIGYNLFYNQNICMPNINNNNQDKTRLQIFNDNITTLIDKSEYFSVRHNGDIELLKKHVPVSLHDKITFQFCPTINYAKSLSSGVKSSNTIAFEIKEDRTWRRYHKTTKKKFFNDILKFCKEIEGEREIAVLLHEPRNTNIIQYLKKYGVELRVIKNYEIWAKRTIENFESIDTLYCMAGHSQMVAMGLGCETKSIITHNKLKFFLEDIGQYKYENYIDPNTEDVYKKLMEVYNG